MLEQVQCIVVSAQGSLGLVQIGQGFGMLRTIVEFDELPVESAHRILRVALGNAANFERIEQLNIISEAEDAIEYTFVLRTKESATDVTRLRGFQWLTPRYRETLEALRPELLGQGVSSTYRRAMATKKVA